MSLFTGATLSDRQDIRSMTSWTTPAETVPWRGMFAAWDPQSQIHLAWPPFSDFTEHPA